MNIQQKKTSSQGKKLKKRWGLDVIRLITTHFIKMFAIG